MVSSLLLFSFIFQPHSGDTGAQLWVLNEWKFGDLINIIFKLGLTLLIFQFKMKIMYTQFVS